jgi:quinohemoprotein ethanol dehydrogenase
MKFTTKWRIGAIATVFGVIAACSGLPAQSPGETNATDSADAAPIYNAQLPANGWPTNGGDEFNRRFSPLDQINRDNVADLKGVWRARLDGSGVGPQYSGEAQPIVDDGIIYIITGADDLFAYDVESGERLWKYEANLAAEIDVICCGWTSRGLGLGEGKIFVGQLNGKLLALDKTTGEIVWEVQAERWQDGYSITSAPLYHDGLVITGFAGAEFATRGRVKAYNAETGEHVWTFYTIPAPGEPGSETWPEHNTVWDKGGATVWHTPAVDPELGLIYFATGNAGPDLNGAVRAGDNLYSSSIVAIEAATGKYRWHFQAVKHDIWDYDLPTPVILFNAEYDGKMRRGLAGTGKTGWVYLLDRETGEPLIGIEDRPVPQEPEQATAASQPFPIGDAYVPQSLDIAPEGYELTNNGAIFTPFGSGHPVPIKPSHLGGANWPPSSLDPTTNLYYVCARDSTSLLRGADRDFEEPEAGDGYIGGEFGMSPVPATGIFAALDVTTNRLVWQQRWPEICYSGSTVTGGGLVFVGRNDGRLTALDSSNGAKLWEFQTGAGMNATASIFEHNGKQYVAAYSAGNLFARSAKGDSLWLFALDGTVGPAESASTVAPANASAAAGSHEAVAGVAADLELGAQVYSTTCRLCHGATGQGNNGGPALNTPLTPEAVAAIVRDGRNLMPAFGAQLSAEDVVSVSAYVAQTYGGG